MSDLIQEYDDRSNIRWKLLTGASALVLTTYVSSAYVANADEATRPQVWIELGGQLARLDNAAEIYTPSFETMRPSIFSPSGETEKLPLYGFDMLGKVSFQPENSDWAFTASIQYGRASTTRHAHQQTYPSAAPKYFGNGNVAPLAARFADTQVRNNEQRVVVDFQAGKDFGIGMFGKHGESKVDLGIRFAQFTQASSMTFRSDPDWHFVKRYYGGALTYFLQPYHSNAAGLSAERSFRGIGPSLSWSASAPFAGDPRDGELTVNWGVNLGVLFGRQKAQTQHHAAEVYNSTGSIFDLVVGNHNRTTVASSAPPASIRSHSVVVPNIGGFAGISWRYDAAKVSFGYKADFFFGAMDGGIDVRRTEDVGFHGPFATISIGLGG
jgi:hypothetical protein